MKGLKLCVQWPRFGPYHLARLNTLHEACSHAGIRLIALETAVSDQLYEWDVERDTTAFDRIQVFTDRPFEQIAPREMSEGIMEALAEVKPDVVAIHTYSFPDSRACLDWCVQNGKGSILMTDSKADDAPRSFWREYLKSLLVRTYDAALLAGTPQYDYFTSLGFPPEAIHLGYDVVDNDFFKRGAERARRDRQSVAHLPGLEREDRYFLASNRFIARKNLPLLLDAYARYRSMCREPWRLVLLGDGPLRAELEAKVSDESIGGVTFAGFQQINDLPSYYGCAGCFVHAATIDTWALVVNEAMAAGLPVIVSTGAGCHADLVIDGENGFTFDPSDTEALADRMIRIAEDDAFQIHASKVSRRIISEWSLERFGQSMLEAVGTAKARTGRGMHPLVRLMNAVLRRAGSVDAFHTVES